MQHCSGRFVIPNQEDIDAREDMYCSYWYSAGWGAERVRLHREYADAKSPFGPGIAQKIFKSYNFEAIPELHSTISYNIFMLQDGQ